MNKKDSEIFIKAIEFLDNHPAVNKGEDYSFFTNNLSWGVYLTCKNGIYKDHISIPDNKVIVRVYEDDPKYNFFKHLKKTKGFRKGDFVKVSYKEYYGYDWKYDHIEYHCDYSIFKFLNNIGMSVYDCNNWMALEGESFISAHSFEEIIITAARSVKDNYGDFNRDSFTSKIEKDNTKKSITKFINSLKSSKTVLMNGVDVDRPSWGEINSRWWDWYKITDHCKKNWQQYAEK